MCVTVLSGGWDSPPQWPGGEVWTKKPGVGRLRSRAPTVSGVSPEERVDVTDDMLRSRRTPDPHLLRVRSQVNAQPCDRPSLKPSALSLVDQMGSAN